MVDDDGWHSSDLITYSLTRQAFSAVIETNFAAYWRVMKNLQIIYFPVIHGPWLHKASMAIQYWHTHRATCVIHYNNARYHRVVPYSPYLTGLRLRRNRLPFELPLVVDLPEIWYIETGDKERHSWLINHRSSSLVAFLSLQTILLLSCNPEGSSPENIVLWCPNLALAGHNRHYRKSGLVSYIVLVCSRSCSARTFHILPATALALIKPPIVICFQPQWRRKVSIISSSFMHWLALPVTIIDSHPHGQRPERHNRQTRVQQSYTNRQMRHIL